MSSMPYEHRAVSPVMRVTAQALDDVRAWACAGYPNEMCGLLVGRSLEVVRAVPARNRAGERARERYELDPLDHLAAECAAQEQGLEIVGVWHSHPDHPARPSEADRLAAWEGWSYWIVAVSAAGAGEIRAWRLNGARELVEETLELA